MKGLVTQSGVRIYGVVPALDEVEAGHLCLYLGNEAALLKQFAFERVEETLAHDVVKRVAD